MKMMMIEAPETCELCPFWHDCELGYDFCVCQRFNKQVYVSDGRLPECIDKDVEVEDEK